MPELSERENLLNILNELEINLDDLNNLLNGNIVNTSNNKYIFNNKINYFLNNRIFFRDKIIVNDIKSFINYGAVRSLIDFFNVTTIDMFDIVDT